MPVFHYKESANKLRRVYLTGQETYTVGDLFNQLNLPISEKELNQRIERHAGIWQLHDEKNAVELKAGDSFQFSGRQFTYQGDEWNDFKLPESIQLESGDGSIYILDKKLTLIGSAPYCDILIQGQSAITYLLSVTENQVLLIENNGAGKIKPVVNGELLDFAGGKIRLLIPASIQTGKTVSPASSASTAGKTEVDAAASKTQIDSSNKTMIAGFSSFTVEITEGRFAGRKADIVRFPFVIGRTQGDFIIPDDTISSQHLRLTLVAGILFAEDLNSTNGTFNGKNKITKEEISAAVTLKLGNIFVKLSPKNSDSSNKTQVKTATETESVIDPNKTLIFKR